MGEIQKRTDEIRVETENEATEPIQEIKADAKKDGAEITNYSTTHKIKKSKGEIIDDYFIVKIVKVW